MADPGSFEENLAKIRLRFLERINNNVPLFQSLLEAVTSGKYSNEMLEAAHIEIHKIKGASRTFGFEELGEIAATAEEDSKNLLATGAGEGELEKSLRLLIQHIETQINP